MKKNLFEKAVLIIALVALAIPSAISAQKCDPNQPGCEGGGGGGLGYKKPVTHECSCTIEQEVMGGTLGINLDGVGLNGTKTKITKKGQRQECQEGGSYACDPSCNVKC